MSRTPCVVVLAAGRGSRYREIAGVDQDKLLAMCVGRDGVTRSVLEQVLLTIQQAVDKTAVDRVVLVTRPDQLDVITLARRFGCQVHLLDSAGMGDSIAAGVAAAPDHHGWLMVLGDMPFILPETVRRLIMSMSDESISVPVNVGVVGHPVAFGRRLYPELVALSGERGARRLFQPGLVREISVADPGVLWDVDTPAALLFRP